MSAFREFHARDVAAVCIDAQYNFGFGDSGPMLVQGDLTRMFAAHDVFTAVVGMGWPLARRRAAQDITHLEHMARNDDAQPVFTIPAGAFIYGKNIDNACSNPQFANDMKLQAGTVIMYGNDLTVCVLATARALKAMGKDVYVVRDAGKTAHELTVDRLYQGLGVPLITSDQIHVEDGMVRIKPPRPARTPDLRRLPEAEYN